MLQPLQRFFMSWHDQVRWEIFAGGLQAFCAKPLAGWGYDNFTAAYPFFSAKLHSHAHNDLLQVGVGLGLIGLVLYGWFLWELWKTYRDDPLVLSVAGALFVLAKMNPIAFVPLGCLALLMTKGTMPRAAAPVLFMIVLCLAAVRIPADRLYGRSRALMAQGQMTKAMELMPDILSAAPDELTYRAKFFMDYQTTLQTAGFAGDRAKILHSMRFLVDDGMRFHSGNPLLQGMDRSCKDAFKSSVSRLARPPRIGDIPPIIPGVGRVRTKKSHKGA